ncbi:MAG: alkaline phosphatase family protein, partial [Polyangiaceae bacterium]
SFRDEKVDFAVGHVVYSDRVAHDGGVHSEAYRAAYRSVDRLIAELDQKIAPEDTLVVTGDHGHTDSGRHSLGLDVPSFTVYRGPGFRPGLSLGTIPIAEHRWLMSWGMKLPLGGGYASSRHPEGLISGERPRPASFSEAASTPTRSRSRSNLWHVVLTIVWLNVGVLATLWLGLLWQVWLDPRRVKVGFWLAIVCSLGMAVSPWSALLALLIAVSVFLAEHRAGNRRALIGLGLGVLASAACFGWGTGMALVRDVVHYPNMSQMRGAALLLFVATALGAYRFGAVRTSWFVVGGVGLFFYPTVYRYGAMPALVNMWLCWVIALAVEARGGAGRGRYLLAVLSFAIFALVQPFAFSDAGNFEHHSWHAWIDWLSPSGHQRWMAASLALKLFLFVPWRGHHALKAIGAFVAIGLHFVMWKIYVPPAGLWFAAVVILASVAWWFPRRLNRDTGAELRRVAGLAILMLLYSYTIRIPVHHYMWADFFLSALYLSALMAKRFSRAEECGHHYA